MKRNPARWLIAGALLLAATVCASPADAAFRLENVKFRMQGRQAIGFGGPITDTTFVSAAPARADTTTEWTMLDAEPYPTHLAGATSATADSAACGHVIVTGDSSVASTVDFTNTTVTLQVNYGDKSTGWQNLASAYSVLATAGQKTILVPIFQRLASITTDLGIDYATLGSVWAPRMRAIVTWGTSAAVPSARVRVRKWIGPASVPANERPGDIVR